MATLNINGQRVSVDDSFLKMSPDQQNATVEEITKSLSPPQQPQDSAVVPGNTDTGMARLIKGDSVNDQPLVVGNAPRVGRHLSFEEGATLLDQEGARGAALAGSSAFINGIPIVGPYLQSGIQGAATGLRSIIDGEPYADVKKRVDLATQGAQEQHPNITTTGQIAGAVVPMIGIGATQAGAQALGITGKNLGARALASGLSNFGISSADTLARGGSADSAVGSGVVGGTIGAAVPIVGSGIKAGIGAVADRFAPTIRALISPDEEAARRVGVAMSRDAAGNPTQLLSPTDEVVAQQTAVPLVNADRGGDVTRALVRSVANQSPEARATITKVADDRFGSQSQRAVDFVRSVAGGNADDLAYQDMLRQTAQAANKPAYDAAFSNPAAQALYTPRLQQLMQSPSFRSAVAKVPARSADRGAVQGFQELGNPFSVNSQGNYVLRQSADGKLVTPTLQFWDQVKRNLDSQIGVAKRAGDNTRVSDLMGLKSTMVGELDSAVPAYQTARQGAAGFFGAEDALDAGRKFADTPRLVPEAQRAFSAFSPAEKQAFSTGYASSLIDKIRASGDRTNVINATFKSQAARDSMNMVFGPKKAQQIEAYVRVEDLADKLRGSLGNSTTARQLVELGIGAGVGGGAGYGLTGDWKGAAIGAIAPKAIKYVGAKADTQVMQSMAKLLTQDNPGSLKIAAQIAAKQPAYMDALDKLGAVLAAPARGMAIQHN